MKLNSNIRTILGGGGNLLKSQRIKFLKQILKNYVRFYFGTPRFKVMIYIILSDKSKANKWRKRT